MLRYVLMHEQFSGVVCSSSGAICTAVGNTPSNAPLSYVSTNGSVDWALSTTQPPLDNSGGGQLLGVN